MAAKLLCPAYEIPTEVRKQLITPYCSLFQLSSPSFMKLFGAFADGWSTETTKISFLFHKFCKVFIV